MCVISGAMATNSVRATDRKEVPVVAMLLAMSIVLNLDESTLRKAKMILEKA